jgi:hypothetical protein
MQMRRVFPIPRLLRFMALLGFAWALVLPGRAEVLFSTTNSTWKVLKGFGEASVPNTAWRLPEFNDSAWFSAPAPFYYTATATEPPFYNGGPVTGTVLGDMLNNYTCVFLRKTFQVTNAAGAGQVTVEVAADDGFIVWLNGLEVSRTNMPTGTVAYNGRALASLAEPYPIQTFLLNAATWLREGTNVLAVQGFNWDPTSGDFGIMAGLSTTADQTPPISLQLEPPDSATVSELTAIDVVFSEPVTNVDAADLLINGAAATSVNSNSGAHFIFEFPQPNTGAVAVAWAATHGITDFSGNAFAGGAWTYQLNTNRIGTLIISEFMADNDGSLLDGLGEPSDWIELHNPTDSAVNLAGWKLRDSSTEWTFTAAVLPAGGYLIVFASDKAAQPFTDADGYLHTNFKLAAEGDALALLRPDGSVAWEYAAPGPQIKGVSFGVLQTTTNVFTYDSAARILVPTAPVAAAWTNAAFNDTAWLAGQASAGYGIVGGGGTVAYRVHPGTPGAQAFGGALGMDFVANQNVTITELGCFDDNSDGLTLPITVQLWQRNENGTPLNFSDDTGGSVLASATFTPGDPGTLFEGSRFKPLASPLALPTGAYTIIAYGYGTGERNGNLGGSIPPDPWETQSGGGLLSFVGFGRPGAAGTFPTTVDGGPANRYAAGTFKFAGAGGTLARTPLTMQNVNPAAFMRVRFNVANPATYESLTLQLGYDDGCIVWLNGAEVARRNAPAAPAYNSTATQATNRVEEISLSASLLISGTNLLAIQGFNISVSDGDFFMGAALTATDSQAASPRYLTNATPGAPNPSTGVVGYVADTKFSVKRGFYDVPFDLAITNATPGAIIRYTLDGSLPTESRGTLYTAPIHITSTTVVRAFAYKAGFQSANVDTHSYLFANDVAVQPSAAPSGYPASWTDYTGGGTVTADYGMIDPVAQAANYARAAGNASFTVPQARAALSNSVKALSVISIVTDKANLFDPGSGIYLHPASRGEAWERPASVELITTNGVEDWHASAGIHIMGLTSRSLSITPKLNLMLLFNTQYGTPWLTEPFFGTNGPNRIKRIALRTNTRESWLYEENGFGTGTYIVDGFAKESLLDSGEPGTRHRYCHVFLNGLYWGIYDATERPESHWAETTFGGEDEDYDVINLCCPNRIDAGDFTEWQQLLSMARAGLSTEAAYQAIQGNNPDGTRNPALKQLLGVDSLIGFMINGYYHGGLDWPDNFFAVYDNVANRTKGWRFVTWDTDLGFGNFNPNFNRVDSGPWFSHDDPYAVEHALRSNPEYRMREADRVYREYFHTGAYVTATNLARWQRLRAAIQPGLYAESARWGDYRAGGLRTVQEHWLPRVNGTAASNWFAGRNAAVISQLRAINLYPSINPPEFNQWGGNVPAGFPVRLTNVNAGGAIYVTFDGTDPRLAGGAISPTAQVYTQAVVLTSPTVVRARVRSNTTWSALSQAQFYPPQDFSKLQLSEIMYNPPKSGLVDGEEFEFLEMKNSGTNLLELTGVSFTRGITFAFTNETTLAPGQYFVLARNAVQYAARYPNAPLHGLYSGKLDNNGETLELATAPGGTIFSVKYNNAAPWSAEADNSGLSLQRINFAGEATNALTWIAAPPTPGGSVPSELLDNDGDGLPDGWELAHSVSDPLADDDGDGMTNYQEFRAGTDPRDEDDTLRLHSAAATLTSGSMTVTLGFTARSNKTYTVLYRNSADSGLWNTLQNYSAQPTNQFVNVTKLISATNSSVFFRLATPRIP